MKKLRILVVGDGAREHALVWKIAQSPLVDHIFAAPGNAGMAAKATNINIAMDDFDALITFAKETHIDLTVVGPRDPIAHGIVDAFSAENLPIFGPTQAAARLEASKIYSKSFMQRHAIPTPAFAAFDDVNAALDYLNEQPEGGVVVKINGMGKDGLGVTVCDTLAEAREAVLAYMFDEQFGDEGTQIIIEERIHGREISMFALSDGLTVVPVMPVRDHKRLLDGDNGPNTGGMGAFGPPPDVDDVLLSQIQTTILEPTIRGMAAENVPYVGVLYAGLMVTEQGLQLIEYNCRFGNPEAEVVMMLLESDLVEAMLACVSGDLQASHVVMGDGAAASVVMAVGPHPANNEPGLGISGINSAENIPNTTIFHHSTICENGQLKTGQAGRTLAVTARGSTLTSAIDTAYAAVGQISFAGAHYRNDIGRHQFCLEPCLPMLLPKWTQTSL